MGIELYSATASICGARFVIISHYVAQVGMTHISRASSIGGDGLSYYLLNVISADMSRVFGKMASINNLWQSLPRLHQSDAVRFRMLRLIFLSPFIGINSAFRYRRLSTLAIACYQALISIIRVAASSTAHSILGRSHVTGGDLPGASRYWSASTF